MNTKNNTIKTNYTRLRRFALMNAGLISAIIPINMTAHADENTLQLEEIVVTAQKRETNLQTTPIAISSFSSEALSSRDITDTQSLSFAVPGLIHSEAVTNGQITLRGIGLDIPNLAGEPGVAFHVDGVYIKSLTQITAAFSELERVEVLRGPQGTLYGRNATGGAINLITKEPSEEFEAEASIKYGNYDRIATRVGVSGPLSDAVAGRISYEYETRNGYTKNLATGRDLDDANRHSVRGSLYFTPSEEFSIIVRGDYQIDNFSGIPDQPLSGGPNDALIGIDNSLGEDVVQTLVTGGRITLNPRTVFHNFDNNFRREVYGFSAEANYDAGDIQLKSITAYRSDSLDVNTDSDGTDVLGLHITNLAETDQFSQEIQISSSYEGPFNFILGAYYFKADDFLSIDADFGISFLADSNQDTETIAFFGESYYDFSDNLKVTVGARWTQDKKSFDTVNNFAPAGVTNDVTFKNFLPKIGLDFQINDDVFAYATISKGFKSGGFNIFGSGGAFDEEKVWAYEIGLKSTLLQNSLRLNLTSFFYDYKDLQVTQFPGDGTQFISNAANAKIYGLEADFQFIANEWVEFDGSVSYLDAHFETFITADVLDPAGPLADLSGNKLIRAPEFSANMGVNVTLPVSNDISSVLRVEYSYVDDYFFSAFNRSPAVQKSHSLVNAFLTVEGDSELWKLSFYGKNLTNKDIRSSAFEVPAVGGYLAPRTYGAMLSFKFQ